MHTGAAIAASLAAAMALPGCGEAGSRPPQRAGAVSLPRAGDGAGRDPVRSREQQARGPVRTPTADAGPPREVNRKLRRRAARRVTPSPARRAAPGRPAVPPSTLVRAFQILRRPARSGDRPAGQARALLAAETREDRRQGEDVPNLAAARRLPAAHGLPPSWIVPAGDRVCLLRQVPGGPRAPETIECVGAAAATRGYLMSAITGLPGGAEQSSLEGVLPAGAHDAMLELADGAWIALGLRDGAYAVSAAGSTAIRFRRARHELSVRVPHAPSGAAPQL
jgi:hypothetical protein